MNSLRRYLWGGLLVLAAAVPAGAESADGKSFSHGYAASGPMQAEIEKLRGKKNPTRQELDRLSATIHGVSVLNTTPPIATAPIPVPARPQGQLKLNAVLSAEPAPSRAPAATSSLAGRFLDSLNKK